jgi:hypothetical protein
VSRATDICTCNKTREEHGAYDVEQHNFFPHPQPNSVPRKGMIDRLREFLGSQGSVGITAANEFGYAFDGEESFRLVEEDGKVWEVSIRLRKDPAANSGGV